MGRKVNNTGTFRESIKKAHSKAFSQAKKKVPAVDATEIMKILAQLFEARDSKERDAILKDLHDQYGSAAKVYAQVFSETFIKNAINKGLRSTDREEFQKLAKNRFADALVSSSKKIINLVSRYNKGELTQEEFVLQLSKAGIGEIGTKLIDAFGIDPAKFTSNPAEILRLAGPALAYQGFMGAYKEYCKALHDLQMAREERLLVEEACNESVAMIREYRQLMEERVSAYLEEHMETFQEGFCAMDEAILKDDPDGFIAGNVQIQQILKYDTQFTNFDEFDSLMESDMDFKL